MKYWTALLDRFGRHTPVSPVPTAHAAATVPAPEAAASTPDVPPPAGS